MAPIHLQVQETVPIHFSLDRPHVPPSFLEQRAWQLISEVGFSDEQIVVEVSLCRSQRQSLAATLAAHSLVVLGGGIHWWQRHDRRLAQWLRSQGHHVLFVPAIPKAPPDPNLDRGRLAVYLRSMGYPGAEGLGPDVHPAPSSL